jgi:hypothetical protein
VYRVIRFSHSLAFFATLGQSCSDFRWRSEDDYSPGLSTIRAPSQGK